MISTTTSKKIKNLILFVSKILLFIIIISLIGIIKDNKVVLVGVPDKDLLSRFKTVFEEDKGNEHV